jgi:hypothetical protein
MDLAITLNGVNRHRCLRARLMSATSIVYQRFLELNFSFMRIFVRSCLKALR